MDVIEDINSDEISRIFKEKSCERQEKQCFWSKKYLKKEEKLSGRWNGYGSSFVSRNDKSDILYINE